MGTIWSRMQPEIYPTLSCVHMLISIEYTGVVMHTPRTCLGRYCTRLEYVVLFTTHILPYDQAAAFNQHYAWQQGRSADKDFVLHDGPPYANGEPHMGHLLNKVGASCGALLTATCTL